MVLSILCLRLHLPFPSHNLSSWVSCCRKLSLGLKPSHRHVIAFRRLASRETQSLSEWDKFPLMQSLRPYRLARSVQGWTAVRSSSALAPFIGEGRPLWDLHLCLYTVVSSARASRMLLAPWCLMLKSRAGRVRADTWVNCRLYQECLVNDNEQMPCTYYTISHLKLSPVVYRCY